MALWSISSNRLAKLYDLFLSIVGFREALAKAACYAGPVGTPPYGFDWNCLEPFPLYRVNMVRFQNFPRALLDHKYFSKQRCQYLFLFQNKYGNSLDSIV